MKLTRRTEYALRVLVSLSHGHEEGVVPSRALAAETGVPLPFLQQILLQLKDLGWVDSLQGRHGGYRLSADTSQISLGEVLKQFEERDLDSEGHAGPDSQLSIQAPDYASSIRLLSYHFVDQYTLDDLIHGRLVALPVRHHEVPCEDGFGI